jgi:hypothetical protein
MEQCLDLDVQMTSHSGQSMVESNLERRSRKGMSGLVRYPGSFLAAMIAKTRERIEMIERQYSQMM